MGGTKKVFARGIVAAAMAFAVVLPATPAQAITGAEVYAIATRIVGIYKTIKSLTSGGGTTIDEAISIITAKIEEAKVEILNHIDAIATAEARACARQHVIEFKDINLFTPDVLQSWAQDVTGCVTLVDSLIYTVQDKSQIDLLGFALNDVGGIALMARMKAGFSTALLKDTLVHANNGIVTRLFPVCRDYAQKYPGEPTIYVYECTGYNGDYADVESRTSIPASWKISTQDEATDTTSRVVSKAALVELATL